jgi:hypothetical protein
MNLLAGCNFVIIAAMFIYENELRERDLCVFCAANALPLLPKMRIKFEEPIVSSIEISFLNAQRLYRR